jgi:hypothetical protein
MPRLGASALALALLPALLFAPAPARADSDCTVAVPVPGLDKALLTHHSFKLLPGNRSRERGRAGKTEILLERDGCADVASYYLSFGVQGAPPATAQEIAQRWLALFDQHAAVFAHTPYGQMPLLVQAVRDLAAGKREVQAGQRFCVLAAISGANELKAIGTDDDCTGWLVLGAPRSHGTFLKVQYSTAM